MLTALEATSSHPLAGPALALAASLCWAISPIIGAPAARAIGALQFTRLRSAIAAVLLVSAALILGRQKPLELLPVGFLIASATIGIALGDVLLFFSLKVLGPRRSGLLYACNVPLSAILAWACLDERFSVVQGVGFSLAVFGLMVAIGSRHANTKAESLPHQGFSLAFCAGIGAALCQALGTIIAKPAFRMGISAIDASAIRVTTAAVLLNIAASKRPAGLDGNILKRTAATAIIGTGLGVSCLMMALSIDKVGMVSMFSSLAPLLMLPILAMNDQEKPRPLAWVGCLVTISGLALILLQR